MREKKDVRVFFALWPNSQMRRKLQSCARLMPVERPARRVPEYNLHLTLHFIGNVYIEELDCLRRQALKVSGSKFELTINRHGSFRKARVGWLGCSEMPPALGRLHRDLGQVLSPCGYRPEARAYNPHVTVARKLNRTPDVPDFEPMRWQVDDFVLIESRATDSGVRYEVIETYPLT